MRPSLDLYFLTIAKVVSLRSTCLSRSVGCVLTNKDGNLLSSGYNGFASSLPNCIDTSCKREGSKSGENLHLCGAIHSEQNALLQCSNIREIHTAYITASPCITCVKLFMNTGCKRIVFVDQYPHSESENMWKSLNREWIQIPIQDVLNQLKEKLNE